MKFRLAARLQGRLHYAWIVAALTFLTLLVVAGIRATPSVLIVPLEHSFGWGRDQITLAVSIGLFLFGMMGPFAAAAMQRFGVRRTMIVALILLAAAMGGSAFVRTPLQLVLTWGVLAGLGTGTMAMVLGVTIVTRWFDARRGSVLGLPHGEHRDRATAVPAAAGLGRFAPGLARRRLDRQRRRIVAYSTCILLHAGAPDRCRPAPLWRYPRRSRRRHEGQPDRNSVPRACRGCTHAHVLAVVPDVLRLRAQH
jgi:MFS family permease